MMTNDLRFLLKEKYLYNETQTQETIKLITANKLEDVNKSIIKDLYLLKNGTPIAYIIGHIDFLNCHIDLSKRPLIPRQETEFWVENAISKITQNQNLKILDIFCGSGCIGTAIAQNLKTNNIKLQITFSDIEPNAIEQSQINFNSNLKNKANITAKYFISDVFMNIPLDKFDYIFANPPYVSRTDAVGFSTKYEPQNALYPMVENNNDETVIEFLAKFLIEAKEFLKEDATLFVETSGEKQVRLLMNNELIKNIYSNISVQVDQYNIKRILMLKR